MNAIERRESRGLFPDLLDLLESPFTMLRPLAGVTGHAMRVEDYVDDGRYVIRAELPGIDPDKDVEITLTGDTLRIRAERREEHKEAHRSEFHYGSFSRALSLPAGVTAEDITASYDKGILQITVPMPEVEKAATRHIAVEQKSR